MIEKEKREYALFCFLKKRAIGLLKEGKGLLEAEEVLIDYLRELGFMEKEAGQKVRKDMRDNFRDPGFYEEEAEGFLMATHFFDEAPG